MTAPIGQPEAKFHHFGLPTFFSDGDWLGIAHNLEGGPQARIKQGEKGCSGPFAFFHHLFFYLLFLLH